MAFLLDTSILVRLANADDVQNPDGNLSGCLCGTVCHRDFCPALRHKELLREIS